MRIQRTILLGALGCISLAPVLARADEAADKQAEIQRKKDEAKKKAEAKAEEKKKAADKAAADKAAADKAAADKAAADKVGAGGTTGAGGAAATASAGATATASGGTGGTASTSSGGAAGAGGKAAGGAAAKADEKDAALPAGDIATLRKDRPERRKASVERLRRRWGSLLAEARGAEDLKQHSRRVAFLQRARIVAEAKKDKKSVELVDELLTKEDQRHSTAMNALREGALGGGTIK